MCRFLVLILLLVLVKTSAQMWKHFSSSISEQVKSAAAVGTLPIVLLNVLRVLLNVLIVLHNVLIVLPNVLRVLRNLPGVLRNVVLPIIWKRIALHKGRGRPHWQDWYIF